MEALINATIPVKPRFPNQSTAKHHHHHHRPQKASVMCCSMKKKEVNGTFDTPFHIKFQNPDVGDTSEDEFQPRSFDAGTKEADIWKLFKEAQQNILYLNKERIRAIEELNSTIKEKELLLDKIEQLEQGKQTGSMKDNISSGWELLLRIDCMVLNGKINIAEANEMRQLVMDCKASVTNAFYDIQQKTDAELLAELRNFAMTSKRIGFHIVHICTEMEPLLSIGSLAPYITGLSHALQRKGYMVEVILPKYSILHLDELQGLQEIPAESYSYFNGQLHGNRIWTGIIHGIGVTLIEPKHYSSFFSREKVYGYSDDFERFTYFSRAALDYLVKSGKKPDVIHIHNWQTSIVGPLFWDIFVNQGLEKTRILLTCQDLHSQCIAQPDKLALCGLDPARLHRPDRLQDSTNSSLVNLLKGGIVYSNKVILLSSLNSRGKIMHTSGHGLETTLATHKEKLLTAPPGFDYSKWDPLLDGFLPKNYSADDMQGKTDCKVMLQQQVGLPSDASASLVGCIMAEVSDIDLQFLRTQVLSNARRGIQFVFIIGRTPTLDRVLESFLEELKVENVRVIHSYDEAFSHLVFAGSDIILCQSFHDPILQVPLKALKYGAAPVAMDSENERFRHFTDHDDEPTKYARFLTSTFKNMTLSQAIDEMRSSPSKWTRKIIDAMMQDFSWDGECSDIHISAYTALKKL